MLADDSATVRFLSRAVDAPATAWDHSRIKQGIDGLLTLPFPLRLKLAGYALLTAVFTHAILTAALGIAVHALGWTTRGMLVLMSLILVLRPDACAAAWRERSSR